MAPAVQQFLTGWTPPRQRCHAARPDLGRLLWRGGLGHHRPVVVAQRRPHAGDEAICDPPHRQRPPASKPNVVPNPASAIKASSGLLAIIGALRARTMHTGPGPQPPLPCHPPDAFDKTFSGNALGFRLHRVRKISRCGASRIVRAQPTPGLAGGYPACITAAIDDSAWPFVWIKASDLGEERSQTTPVQISHGDLQRGNETSLAAAVWGGAAGSPGPAAWPNGRFQISVEGAAGL